MNESEIDKALNLLFEIQLMIKTLEELKHKLIISLIL